MAEYRSRVVGYVHVADFKPLYFDSLAYLLGLAVAEDYRRQGVASALIK